VLRVHSPSCPAGWTPSVILITEGVRKSGLSEEWPGGVKLIVHLAPPPCWRKPLSRRATLGGTPWQMRPASGAFVCKGSPAWESGVSTRCWLSADYFLAQPCGCLGDGRRGARRRGRATRAQAGRAGGRRGAGERRRSARQFVSRGGIKLANALEATGLRCRAGARWTWAPRRAGSPTACCSGERGK
jgi:hypothetical protein